MKQFYQTLECPPDSNPDDLRKAWRKKCREHHPDLGGDPQKFLEIMHAYKMLTDPSYQMRTTRQPIRDLTFNVQTSINFLEAFFGTKLTLSYNRVHLDGSLEQIKDSVVDPITLAIEVPCGSTNGLEVKVQGKGMSCGSQMGDAVVRVGVRRHPRYTVKDIDVYCNEEVPLDIMLKGGEVVVDTLWGSKVIWVPAGTRPNDKIRIYEAGVAKKGFQYCTIAPLFPNQQDLKNDTWKGLNINWEQVDEKNKEDDDLMAKFEALKDNKNG